MKEFETMVLNAKPTTIGFRQAEELVRIEFLGTEVVRCKDCKHWDGETHGCERHSSVEPWWETDFCNYGERKGEVEDGI